MTYREQAEELLELLEKATPAPWEATQSGGRDCVWLDIVVGENDREILHAETMPQLHVLHPSCVDNQKETAQHIANLKCVAAIRNAAPALLRRLIELER